MIYILLRPRCTFSILYQDLGYEGNYIHVSAYPFCLLCKTYGSTGEENGHYIRSKSGWKKYILKGGDEDESVKQ